MTKINIYCLNFLLKAILLNVFFFLFFFANDPIKRYEQTVFELNKAFPVVREKRILIRNFYYNQEISL